MPLSLFNALITYISSPSLLPSSRIPLSFFHVLISYSLFCFLTTLISFFYFLLNAIIPDSLFLFSFLTTQLYSICLFICNVVMFYSLTPLLLLYITTLLCYSFFFNVLIPSPSLLYQLSYSAFLR